MKISIVTPSFHPFLGGIELYFLNLSKKLIEKGHEVHVFTVDRMGGKFAGPEEENLDGIKVHRLSVWFESSYRARIWPSLFRRLIENFPDVIHICGHGHFHSLVALFASKINDTPTVVTTYGPLRKQTECATTKEFLFRTYDATITSFVFKSVKKVLARNPFIVPWIKSYGVPDEKIEVTVSGIPSECLKLRDGSKFREKYGLHGPTTLYVGRLSSQKGVHHLVRAIPLVLRKLPEAKFVFLGPDYLNFKNVLVKIGKELGVFDHMLFTGPVYDLDEEMEAYASCDVFVMPSSFEGFCQAAVKAMTQRKPVVATRVGGIPYIVRNNQEGILVEYGDYKSLANSLIKLLSSVELAKMLGERGRKRAQQFTYDILANQMERIYKEVLQLTKD